MVLCLKGRFRGFAPRFWFLCGGALRRISTTSTAVLISSRPVACPHSLCILVRWGRTIIQSPPNPPRRCAVDLSLESRLPEGVSNTAGPPLERSTPAGRLPQPNPTKGEGGTSDPARVSGFLKESRGLLGLSPLTTKRGEPSSK